MSLCNKCLQPVLPEPDPVFPQLVDRAEWQHEAYRRLQNFASDPLPSDDPLLQEVDGWLVRWCETNGESK